VVECIDDTVVICFTEAQANELDLAWEERDTLRSMYEFCRSVVLEQDGRIEYLGNRVSILGDAVAEERRRGRRAWIYGGAIGFGIGLITSIIISL
jgi:hypothetical protein